MIMQSLYPSQAGTLAIFKRGWELIRNSRGVHHEWCLGTSMCHIHWGWKYYVSFTDDTKRYVTLLFLWTKDKAQSRIKAYVNIIKNKFGHPLKYLCFNNGKELINKELEKLAAEKGIIIETTAPYSPSQNGVAERFNQTLLELACAMLIKKDLPVFLWDKAVAHAAYLYNRVPTHALNGITPHEAWTGQKPSMVHLQKFGCNVRILDESKNRSKLSPKSKKMKCTGFVDGSESIHYYDAATWSIKVSRNFAFNENDELQELEVYTDVPGLQAEGEQESSDDFANPEIPDTLPHHKSQLILPIPLRTLPQDQYLREERIWITEK
jgi:hypothetical protein